MVAQTSGDWPLWVKKVSDISQGSVATRGGIIDDYYEVIAESDGDRLLKVGRHLAKLQLQLFDSRVASGAFLSYRVHFKTCNVTLNDF